MRDEFAKIDWLKKRFELNETTRKGTVPVSQVVVGIGDDAAVVDFGNKPSIVTVDTQVEDVHFRRDFISCRQIGKRAVIAAVSDVWAMGAMPGASVIALTLPTRLTDEDFCELIEGIAEATRETGARVVGGNLSQGKSLSITTTVIGLPKAEPLTRSGARPGDGVYVTGVLGAAALGLAVLEASELQLEHAEAYVERWRTPPRHGHIIQELAKNATAAIDVSDGCLQDLQHVCEASEVGAVVYADAVPTAPGYATTCGALGLRPLELALTGGEDYEILFTAPTSRHADALGTKIGEIVTGSEVSVIDADGNPIEMDPTGFRHFS